MREHRDWCMYLWSGIAEHCRCGDHEDAGPGHVEWPPWELRTPAGLSVLRALGDQDQTVRDVAEAAHVGTNHARVLLHLAASAGFVTERVEKTSHGRPPTLYRRTDKPLPPDGWRTRARS